MCRYAMTNYKPHYACFKCRKIFKRRLLSDIEGKEEFLLREAKCPECGNLMANMGKDFEAPKKDNLKDWEHIKRLYTVGITFHSCGCTGPGYIPNTAEKLIAYLEDIRRSYHYNLEFWRQRNEPMTTKEVDRDKSKNWDFINKIPVELRSKKDTIRNEDAIKYWLKRLSEVEQKLSTIK